MKRSKNNKSVTSLWIATGALILILLLIIWLTISDLWGVTDVG